MTFKHVAPDNSPVEVLDLNFDFKSRSSALSRQNFRGQEANLGRAQSRDITEFGQESSYIYDFGRESQNIGQEKLSIGQAQSK